MCVWAGRRGRGQGCIRKSVVGNITQLQGGFEKRGIEPLGPTCSGPPRTLAEQPLLREPSTNRGLGWTRGFCGPRERPLAQTASFPPGSEPKTGEEDPRESEPKRDSCISGSGESWFCCGGGTGRGAAQSPRSGNWSSVAPSHILGSRKSWEPGLGCQPRSSRVQDGLGPRGCRPEAVTKPLALSTESEGCSSWEGSGKRKVTSSDSTCPPAAGRILLWGGGARRGRQVKHAGRGHRGLLRG